MVQGAKSVSGAQDKPNGYSAVKLYDNKTKKTKTFFIPIGQKISFGNKENMKTFDPSKLKNNEIVITGTHGDKNFDMIGLALEHMDTNDDGYIDAKDSGYDIGEKMNKSKNMPNGYFVDQIDPWTHEAYVENGEGYVEFSKSHMDDNPFSVAIDDE